MVSCNTARQAKLVKCELQQMYRHEACLWATGRGGRTSRALIKVLDGCERAGKLGRQRRGVCAPHKPLSLHNKCTQVEM